MIRALSTAATGMQAQEMRLDQLASDMANMNTSGYKRGRTEFQDLMYQNLKEPGGQPGQSQVPVGTQVGSGVRVAAQYAVHEPGPVKITNGLFDMLINGEGFFSVQLPNGQIAYTRDGSFKMDANGQLVTASGYPLIPQIQIPPNSAGVTITSTGEVRVLSHQGGEQTVGQVEITNFLNPASMQKLGENLWRPSVASGAATRGIAGENGLGTVQQGALEGSNVKPTEAIMDMITTQRTYESNAKIMTVSDQMWATTNNIGNR